MEKRTIEIFGPTGRPAPNRKAFISCILTMTILVSIIVSACMDIRIRMGKRVDPGELEKALRLRESTTSDVLLMLGEPFGKGKAMLPVAHPTPRIMWTYYYGEGNMKDGRGMYLFVFFDQDHYDGYMWFSSLAKR
jgi:hypothetical protein